MLNAVQTQNKKTGLAPKIVQSKSEVYNSVYFIKEDCLRHTVKSNWERGRRNPLTLFTDAFREAEAKGEMSFMPSEIHMNKKAVVFKSSQV